MTAIPLSAEPEFQGDKMYLRVLRNGRWERQSLPFLPYLYAREQFDGAVTVQPVTRTILSTRREEKLWRHEFSTNLPVSELNRRYDPKDAVHTAPPILLESHVRFPERVAIDKPFFYRDFPHDRPLRVLTLDTEGKTKQGKALGQNLTGLLTDDFEVIQEPTEDLRTLVNTLGHHDVVTGYNLDGYDWPLIERYAQARGVTLPAEFLRYDLARSVFGDQTLHGIKSRGLKSVARHYGFVAEEIDGRNTVNYTDDQLRSYNVSDLWITRALFDIYFPRLLAVAEYMGLPLGMVTEEIPSTVPSIAFARGLRARGVVSDGTNDQRHPELAGRKVQGAFTAFTERGVYWDIFKFDFKQMYPSILLYLNLGPDTAWIEGYEEYGPFSAIREREGTTYRIPDARIGKTVVVHVDESKPGIIAQFLRDVGDMRDRIKALISEQTEGERARSPLHAQENALKVLRNTAYGYTLSKRARFADIATGIVITGIGREMIRLLYEEVQRRWGRLAALEADTDGIYCRTGIGYPSQEEYKVAARQILSDWVRTHLHRDNEFVLDFSFFKAGFFAATKNYLLMDEKDHVIVHGSGLKGRHRPPYFDRVLEEVAAHLLRGEPVDPRPFYKWERYAPEEFIQRVSPGQELHEYENEAIPLQIARQYLARGEPVERGTILEYYFSPEGARAYFAEDPFRPDYKKAKRELDKLFKTLGLVTGGTETIESAIGRAVDKEWSAAARNDYRTCTLCRGLGWYLKKGTVEMVDCDACEGGKVLNV